MSRIGRKIIKIPGNVVVRLEAGKITVSGPKGDLEKGIPSQVSLKLIGRDIGVSVEGSSRKDKAVWGLYRNLVANLVEGVSRSFRKELELSGIGYKVKKEGADLVFSLGFSHPVRFPKVDGVEFEVKDENNLAVVGGDKELVGKTAARIKFLKKPEPYKGKGIKYKGDFIRRKAGKVGKVGSLAGKQ